MSADSQPILLIHGMWMTPRSWDNWVDHYADRGYRAIAPGWPGVNDPEETRRDPSALRPGDQEGRRPLRAGHSRSRPAADHHRPLVRWSLHPGAPRPRPRGGGGRNRHRTSEGRDPVAAVDAARGAAGAQESVQPQRPVPADREAVQMALHEHAEPGGGR